jgi:hypothetical protein
MDDMGTTRHAAHRSWFARKRWWVVLVCTVSLLLLLAGCEASSYVAPGPNTVSTESTLSVATTAESQTTTAVLATTTTTSSTLTSASVTPTTPMAARGTVIYEISDWSTGMGGWAASGEWKTVNGMLVSDGTEDSIAVAPVNLAGQPDYAVEAEMEFFDPEHVNCFLEARLINGEGYYGGYYGWWGSMGIGFGSDRILEADFSVNSDWHTYRFEVTGNSMRLLFDGAEVARAGDNRQLAPGTVGIFCGGQVNVRAFRVIAL